MQGSGSRAIRTHSAGPLSTVARQVLASLDRRAPRFRSAPLKSGADSARSRSITVVVPMFDVAPFVAECVHSLLTQTVAADCELLFVDDGSSDGTSEIVARAIAQVTNARLIRQSNKGPGPGAARNVGLDEASGEFIAFCDGDDALMPSALEMLRAVLEDRNLDVAVGAIERFPAPRKWIWSKYFEPGSSSTPTLDDVPMLVHNAAPGNKLFRRSFLQRHGLRFAEGIHHQDTVVTVPAMALADRIGLVGDVVQRYRKRSSGDSIMDSQFTRPANYWDHLFVEEELVEWLPRLRKSRRRLVKAFIARSFQGYALRAPTMVTPQELREFFLRARAVATTIGMEAIATATQDARHRAAYVALLEDDFHAFREIPRSVQGLVVHGTHLYIDMPATNKAHQELLRTGRAIAEVTDVGVHAAHIAIRGRMRVRGGALPHNALNGLSLRLNPVEPIRWRDGDDRGIVVRSESRRDVD